MNNEIMYILVGVAVPIVLICVFIFTYHEGHLSGQKYERKRILDIIDKMVWDYLDREAKGIDERNGDFLPKTASFAVMKVEEAIKFPVKRTKVKVKHYDKPKRH
jgi:hypothetical protein